MRAAVDVESALAVVPRAVIPAPSAVVAEPVGSAIAAMAPAYADNEIPKASRPVTNDVMSPANATMSAWRLTDKTTGCAVAAAPIVIDAHLTVTTSALSAYVLAVAPIGDGRTSPPMSILTPWKVRRWYPVGSCQAPP